MTLNNLLTTGQLKEHKTTVAEVAQLLGAIRRNIADAKVEAVSDETRFDAAYKAIMQLAMLALLANGYRPATSIPGHHMTMIQSLPKSVGVEKETMNLLDALRRKRNASDYMGSFIDRSAVAASIEQAEALLLRVTGWLAEHRPDLFPS